MDIKKCTKCGIEKSISQFNKRTLPSGKIGYKSHCTSCRTLADKNKQKTRNDKYYSINSDKVKQKAAIWGKNNPHKLAARDAKRRSAKLQRSPTWLSKDDLWLIQQAYELAELRTRLFGMAWHVDHIIPLQGKLVSGLHVPTNLQVIPGIENCKKSNAYQP